ncbi:MAG: elongation factor Ts [bacterium]|jgi:elongation factor Ts
MASITAAMVKELRESTGSGMMECKKALVEAEGDIEQAKDLLRKKGQVIAGKKAGRETKEGSIKIKLADDNKTAALVRFGCETDFVAINDQFQAFIAGMADNAIENGTDNFLENASEDGTTQDSITKAIAGMSENIVFLNGVQWKAADNGFINAYTHSTGKIGVLVEVGVDGSADATKLQALAKDIAMHVAAFDVKALSEDDLDPAVVEKEKQFLTEQALESGKPANIVEKMIVGRIKKFKKDICLLDQAFVKDPTQTVQQILDASGKELGATIKINRFHKEQF